MQPDEHRQVTYVREAVTLPQTTARDANNVERTWRRHKAWWLVSTPGKLTRLLGRQVKP